MQDKKQLLSQDTLQQLAESALEAWMDSGCKLKVTDEKQEEEQEQLTNEVSIYREKIYQIDSDNKTTKAQKKELMVEAKQDVKKALASNSWMATNLREFYLTQKSFDFEASSNIKQKAFMTKFWTDKVGLFSGLGLGGAFQEIIDLMAKNTIDGFTEKLRKKDPQYTVNLFVSQVKKALSGNKKQIGQEIQEFANKTLRWNGVEGGIEALCEHLSKKIDKNPKEDATKILDESFTHKERAWILNKILVWIKKISGNYSRNHRETEKLLYNVLKAAGQESQYKPWVERQKQTKAQKEQGRGI